MKKDLYIDYTGVFIFTFLLFNLCLIPFFVGFVSFFDICLKIYFSYFIRDVYLRCNVYVVYSGFLNFQNMMYQIGLFV